MNTPRRPRSCEVCAQQYVPTYHQQRTCGRMCGAQIKANYRAKTCAVKWLACATCTRWICKPGRVVCSRTCALERNRLRFAEQFVSSAKPTTLPCQDCGEDYSTKTATNCGVCKRCRARRAKAAFGTSDRSRARQFGVEYEPIDRRKVYERDGWRCQLCGKPVRRDVKGPHPLSASLDHVIPMSLGGHHLYANVQCAHFLCNSLKGAGGSQQLALIG